MFTPLSVLKDLPQWGQWTVQGVTQCHGGRIRTKVLSWLSAETNFVRILALSNCFPELLSYPLPVAYHPKRPKLWPSWPYGEEKSK